MKKSKKSLKPLIIASALLISLTSCGIGLIVRGVAKNKYTKENEVIPESFIDEDATLLIMMWGSSSYDKFARKAFDRFYHGKKEYISFTDLANKEKYSDLEKYPFIFSQGDDASMYSGKGASFYYEGSRPFHIFDRKKDKFHMANVTSGFFYRIMQAYAKQMEFYRNAPSI